MYTAHMLVMYIRVHPVQVQEPPTPLVPFMVYTTHLSNFNFKQFLISLGVSEIIHATVEGLGREGGGRRKEREGG